MDGDKIKELRIKNGYTLQEFAEIMCESVPTIQSWEQGWYIDPLTARDIEIMAEHFQMSEDDLRKFIKHYEEDDWDGENDRTSFAGYLDAAVRMAKYVHKVKKTAPPKKEFGPHKLIIKEIKGLFGKKYIIENTDGDVIYNIKEGGLPGSPKMILYNLQKKEIGSIEKEFLGNPRYTLFVNGKKVGSIHHQKKLQLEYVIPEKEWMIKCGVMKTSVYNQENREIVQIEYAGSKKNEKSFVVRYSNKNNEKYAVLIAIAWYMEFYTGKEN